ncbi:MAG TPA: hypothetical protein VGC71_13410 [Gaiellales bacterium]
MRLPVWVTVFISGIVGSWIGRILASLTVVPIALGGTDGHRLASHWVAVLLITAVGQIAVTAVALMLLLPPLSSVDVGFGTAFVATLVGDLVVVLGIALLFGAAMRSDLSQGGAAAMLPALGFASLFLSVLGIAVTTMLINAGSGGHGRNLGGYGGQSYLDQLRDP